MRAAAKRIVRLPKAARWGNLRRRRPFSDNWGFDRGLPIDRFYIESFLAEFEQDVRDRVLEVRDALYTRRYGGARVTRSDVVDIDARNEAATVVADLAVPDSLPARRFDCAIVTQTLQYVDDPRAALANLWQALAAGGVLLVTVPCLQKIDPDSPRLDRWRFTPSGLEELARRACPGGELDTRGYGNLIASTAFLMGLAAHELRRTELEHLDPDFALVACARVRKPAA